MILQSCIDCGEELEVEEITTTTMKNSQFLIKSKEHIIAIHHASLDFLRYAIVSYDKLINIAHQNKKIVYNEKLLEEDGKLNIST